MYYIITQNETISDINESALLTQNNDFGHLLSKYEAFFGKVILVDVIIPRHLFIFSFSEKYFQLPGPFQVCNIKLYICVFT